MTLHKAVYTLLFIPWALFTIANDIWVYLKYDIWEVWLDEYMEKHAKDQPGRPDPYEWD